MKRQPALKFCRCCGAERQAMECIAALIDTADRLDPMRRTIGEAAITRMRAMVRPHKTKHFFDSAAVPPDHPKARREALVAENAVLKGLNAALRQRVAAVVLRCEELEQGLAADCEHLRRELAVTRGLLRDDVDRDDFYEAALAFARAHVESDRIDAIDDSDDPDISDARWTEACARYNETKAALVAAYRAIAASAPEARAEETPRAERHDDHSEG